MSGMGFHPHVVFFAFNLASVRCSISLWPGAWTSSFGMQGPVLPITTLPQGQSERHERMRERVGLRVYGPVDASTARPLQEG